MWKKIISFRFCTNVKINQSKPSVNVESITNININLAMQNLPSIPSVSIVRTKEHAQNVVKILKKLKNRYHAWDTETLEIDPKIQSPVSHGKILCMSCFVGPDIDFGNGPRK
jgi:DNA polymerase-1